ncbi:hypothetical protein F4861DRAFT_522132 [Xylaria intraflava]|nr:hypothetical protein F4861DRAFT_522132 [Xylaria intraflava]
MVLLVLGLTMSARVRVELAPFSFSTFWSFHFGNIVQLGFRFWTLAPLRDMEDEVGIITKLEILRSGESMRAYEFNELRVAA